MNRRTFLSASARFAGAASLMPFARLAHAVGPFADYKALVCLYMHGGNDSHNTIIPLGSEYATYAAARSALAMKNSIDAAADVATDPIFRRPLNGITVANVSGRAFALHTSLKNVATLFNADHAAVVANVGPMIVPTRKQDYQNGVVPLPPQLFAHDHQEAYWKTLSNDLNPRGWGGRMADLMHSARVNGDSPLAVSMSLSGTTEWLRAQASAPYVLSPNRPRAMQAYRSWDTAPGCATCANTQAVFETQIARPRVNKYEDVYGDVLARAIDTQRFISAKLAAIPTFRADFPGTGADLLPLADPNSPGLAESNDNVQNRLADQLRMVARIIAARKTLRAPDNTLPTRQIFYVSIGGFDNHGAEYETHAKLLAAIDSAVAAFYAKINALGDAQNVTLFTASEFGRTLESNGEGSDHGWGGHHFVIGGAVQGGKFYGAPGSNGFPLVALNTATDIGEGRLLPTISTEEYAATLGRWFGLSEAELKITLPNLNNFQQFAGFNVGFMG